MMKKYCIILISLIIAACAQTETVTRASKKNTPQTVVKPQIDRGVYELLNRVEQLQKEIQQLRGQLEEQSYYIADLQKRQKQVLADFEQRLQFLERSGADPEQANEKTINHADARALIPPVDDKPINKKVTGIEKQVYLAAYENLRSGHYAQAITMMKQIIVDYPNGEYADNAQYWLGEAYKISKDNKAAKQAFKKVITNYPDSSKVPDALLKLAYIEFEQGNRIKARRILMRIIDDYGDTAAARLAETKLMQMDGVNFQ